MFASILAYLDPGSGSFLIQLLIGTLVGALVLLRGYWSRIRALFTRSHQSEESLPEGNNQQNTTPS